MSNFLNLVSGKSTIHDKINNLKMKRISTHTQTLNAIKAAIGHKENAKLMFPYYLRSSRKAKNLLRISGRPQHFYKNNAEGCTIKLHKIL